MSKRFALAAAALMLAVGAGGVASAGTVKKTAVAHPRSHASLQCSAEANAKGLHGKARIHFRRDCLHNAMHHASYQKPIVKHVQPASMHKKIDKTDKNT